MPNLKHQSAESKFRSEIRVLSNQLLDLLNSTSHRYQQMILNPAYSFALITLPAYAAQRNRLVSLWQHAMQKLRIKVDKRAHASCHNTYPYREELDQLSNNFTHLDNRLVRQYQIILQHPGCPKLLRNLARRQMSVIKDQLYAISSLVGITASHAKS